MLFHRKAYPREGHETRQGRENRDAQQEAHTSRNPRSSFVPMYKQDVSTVTAHPRPVTPQKGPREAALPQLLISSEPLGMTENNGPHQSQAREICLPTFMPHQAKKVTCTLTPSMDAEYVAMLKGTQSSLAGYHSSKAACWPCRPVPCSPQSPQQTLLLSPPSCPPHSPHHPPFPAQAEVKHDCTSCVWQKVPGGT